MPKAAWLTAEEQRTWLAYIKMSRSLAAGMERQLSGSGLSGADYQVLAPLAEEPSGGMRPRDLCRSTGWDRSRLAHQLERMERRGVVSRSPSPEDGRGTVVHITRAGEQALRDAAPGHVAWVRDHFIDILEPDEMRTLVDLCQRVIRRLEAEDQDE